jgi:hypothetical protein
LEVPGQKAKLRATRNLQELAVGLSPTAPNH